MNFTLTSGFFKVEAAFKLFIIFIKIKNSEIVDIIFFKKTEIVDIIFLKKQKNHDPKLQKNYNINLFD